MAFSDPQSITISGTANSLPRTGSGSASGTFVKDDGTVKLSVSHTYGKRTRRLIRVDHRKIAPDPLQPATNVPYTASVYMVVDAPSAGYSNAELKAIVDGFTAYLTASTGARVTQLLGGES